ncbi:MAG: radical SAM protein [Candidatus Sumerlaeia bacterium]
MYNLCSLPILNSIVNLDLDLTDDCNMRCVYCFKGEKKPHRMSISVAKEAVSWLIKASAKSTSININFMGGEPLLEWDVIEQLVPWAKQISETHGKSISFSLTTNLTLMNEHIRSRFDEWNFGVLMSIDGTEEVQNKQRPTIDGISHFDGMMHWAKSMLRTRPQSDARITITARYADKLMDGVRFLHDTIGFRNFVIAPADISVWDHKDKNKWLDISRDLRNYVIESYSDNSSNYVNISVFTYYAKEMNENTNVIRKSTCGAGKGYLMIDYVGDIWGCHRFDGSCDSQGYGKRLSFGNIFNEHFNHSLHKCFLDMDHARTKHDRCSNCTLFKNCGGGCPAANLEETGSIYIQNENRCWYNNVMYSHTKFILNKIGNRFVHAVC